MIKTDWIGNLLITDPVCICFWFFNVIFMKSWTDGVKGPRLLSWLNRRVTIE